MFYSQHGSNVKFVSMEFGHQIPSTLSPICVDQAINFDTGCGYDTAKEMLSHLYGPLNPPDM